MRHALVVLLLPPAGPLLLAMFGVLFKRRWRQWLVGTGLALAWLSSCTGVVDPLTEAWSRMPTSQQTATQLQPWARQPHTVVLVVGGGLSALAHPHGGYDLKFETLERLRRGVWWARELKLPLAYTGGKAPGAGADQPTEAAMAAQVARDEFRVPLAWSEDASVDTRTNAAYSAQMFQRHGIQRVVLVTHGPHMPRTLRAFRAASPGVTFLAAPVMRDPDPVWRWQDYVPSTSGVARGRYLAYEVVGYLAGK